MHAQAGVLLVTGRRRSGGTPSSTLQLAIRATGSEAGRAPC